jgi:hypoxanthine phosphoribosyltransferase
VKPQVLEVRARRTTRGTQLGQVQLDPVGEGVFARRDVVILDDIADEGRTMEAVQARVLREGPSSLRIAVLVSKLARRRVDLQLDYVGFELEDGWVVGFGMDLDGVYRDLDALAIVETDS